MNAILQTSQPALLLRHTNVTKGTAPSADQYWLWTAVGKDNDSVSGRLATVQTALRSNGSVDIKLSAYKNVKGASTSADLGICYPPTGSPYGFAASTPDGAIDNKIVTADWLYKRGLAETTFYENYDPDTLIKTGYYHIRNDQGKLPSGINGCLLVYATSGAVRQIFFRQGTVDSNDYNIFTRQLGSFVDGVPTKFGAWVQILTSKGGTLTTNLGIKNSRPFLDLHSTSVTIGGSAPSANQYMGTRFFDSNGVEIGVFLSQYGANGLHRVYLTSRAQDDSVIAQMGLIAGNNGLAYAYGPTPSADADNNEIVTAEWVRARSKWTYVHKVLAEAAHEIGEYTLDFSSYLPNDGEDYEVLLNIYCSTSTDTTTNSVLVVYTPGNTRYIQVEAEGKNFEQNTNSALLPVSSTRTIKYTVTNYSFEKITFRVAGYRKA